MSALSITSDLPSTGFAASTGTVGDLYGNALAENVDGSYKNELVHTCSWDGGVEVEIKAIA